MTIQKNDTTKNLLCTLNLLLCLSFSLKAQNQWLRKDTVDAHGVLPSCLPWFPHVTLQRQIKQGTAEVTKEEVDERKLVVCVLREEKEVAAWWKRVD